MRLNQAIASTGFCARRKADELIAAGRVKVNGKVVQDFSRQINPDVDRLTVGRIELKFANHIYVAMNKPAGVVTTRSDESSRETVIDLLPNELRMLRPVGRLDMYSEGLLLLTNDGNFAQQLTHPSMHVSKIYEVKVRGPIEDRHLDMMARGVELDDGTTLPAKVKLISRNKTYSDFEISIREGRNRQIRRMCTHLGYSVVRLVRLGIGRLQLGQIPTGSWRYLTDDEVRLLFPQQKRTD